MNEEEKEALEKAVYYIECETNDTRKKFKIEAYTIQQLVNLIFKQQKEIKELEDEVMKKELLIDGMKEERRIVIEEIQEQYYVSKDKIKEKIEELETYVNDFEEYWSKDPRQFKKEKCIDYYKLEALKELLGEKTNEYKRNSK